MSKIEQKEKILAFEKCILDSKQTVNTNSVYPGGSFYKNYEKCMQKYDIKRPDIVPIDGYSSIRVTTSDRGEYKVEYGKDYKDL